MGYKIDEVEGIGPTYAEKLQGAGIDNTDDLLEKCGGKSGRGNIAEATGISEKLIDRIGKRMSWQSSPTPIAFGCERTRRKSPTVRDMPIVIMMITMAKGSMTSETKLDSMGFSSFPMQTRNC